MGSTSCEAGALTLSQSHSPSISEKYLGNHCYIIPDEKHRKCDFNPLPPPHCGLLTCITITPGNKLGLLGWKSRGDLQPTVPSKTAGSHPGAPTQHYAWGNAEILTVSCLGGRGSEVNVWMNSSLFQNSEVDFRILYKELHILSHSCWIGKDCVYSTHWQ